MTLVRRYRLLLCLVFLTVCQPAFAQAQSQSGQGYFKYQKVMIPMRDGVKLETIILTPRDQQGALPIYFSRTPYGVPKEDAFAGFHPDANSVYADGYIRVVQNIRGRFESEGEFEMTRPPRSLNNPKTTDEVTDAWDSIDWLVKNVPNNNGRVGSRASVARRYVRQRRLPS